MKYSMNYYSKRSRKFDEIYTQEPKISRIITAQRNKKETTSLPEINTGSYQFVVPWQLP